FYVRATLAGAFDLSATAPGLAQATQPLAVESGPGGVLAFTTSGQSLSAGACSSVVTLGIRDAFGNAAVTDSARHVEVISTSAQAALFSDATCVTALSNPVQLPSGTDGLAFYFRDSLAGAPTLEAGGGSWTGTAAQSQTIFAGPAAALQV